MPVVMLAVWTKWTVPVTLVDQPLQQREVLFRPAVTSSNEPDLCCAQGLADHLRGVGNTDDGHRFCLFHEQQHCINNGL